MSKAKRAPKKDKERTEKVKLIPRKEYQQRGYSA